jgi:hypothetical protein
MPEEGGAAKHAPAKMTEFARSSVVYRELRAAFAPWCKASGYRRQRGTDASWVRALDQSEDLSFGFHCNAWGGGAIGGSSFHGLVQTGATGSAAGTSVNRQADISLCLAAAELDELRRIQNAINGRRPRTAEIEAWMREDSPLGEHTRLMYKQFDSGEKPYQAGEFVRFEYFGLEDVRAHAEFLVRRLPSLIVRFVEGRCAQPAPRPQPPFFLRG